MYFGRQFPDFIATLNYFTTKQGGRKTLAHSGYRPQIKFPNYIISTSGEQIFIDKKTVFPGDTLDAEMTILSVDQFQNKLFVGLTFEIREGSRVIGSGQINKIINKDLEIK